MQWFLGRKRDFATLVDVYMHKKQISFFPYVKISYIFLALPVTLPAWNLLDSRFYYEDTRGTTPFHFSPNIFSLSCQFYVLKILVNIEWLKSYWLSTMIFQCTSKRSSFEREVGGSFKFIYECPLYYVAGGLEWNRMVLDTKGGGEGGIFNFFAEIINHLPIGSTSRVANFVKFCYITSI